MTEIINLRQARKRRQRAEKDRQAEQNRRRFGRSKGESRQETAERDRQDRGWRGHEVESESEPDKKPEPESGD